MYYMSGVLTDHALVGWRLFARYIDKCNNHSINYLQCADAAVARSV
jgi:hypothetical protein